MFDYGKDGFWHGVAYWIYHNQTLIAGILALMAAWVTVRKLREQIEQSDRHRKDTIRRQNIAGRAGMLRALSEIIEYSEGCIIYLEALRKLWVKDNNGSPFGKKKDFPEFPIYPQKAFDQVRSVVEMATEGDAKILVGLIAWSQIQNSRFTGFIKDVNQENPQGCNNLVIEFSFHGKIRDAVGLYKYAERIFPYARPPFVEISKPFSAEEAIATLLMQFNLHDEDLKRIIKQGWEVDFQEMHDNFKKYM